MYRADTVSAEAPQSVTVNANSGADSYMTLRVERAVPRACARERAGTTQNSHALKKQLYNRLLYRTVPRLFITF